MRVQVVGAGVAGLCVANELSSRGVEVSLHDKHSPPGPHACSWWAGGMLAPFCEGESAEEPVIRLGRRAASWWQKFTGAVDYKGSLVLSAKRDKNELLRFASMTSHHRWVDHLSIAELEPDLAGHIRQGLYFDSEAHLDPRVALARLVDTLASQGVVCTQEEPLSDILTIDCRGLAAKDALADLRGVKGEMLILKSPELNISRPVRFIHPRMPLYIVPRGSGVYMLGATMIESSDRSRITARSMLELLSAAYALHPAFAESEVLEIGVDVRPAFPDNLPRIRRRGNRLFINGLYRHGYLLAPALAEMTADYILTHKQPELMDECTI